MKQENDWVLEKANQLKANWIMTLYTYHLLSGETVLCRVIKSDTVKKYLLDVANFICRFRDHDPRRVREWDTSLCPEITKLCKAAKDWEQVPDRKEPFTIDMLKDLQRRCTDPRAHSLLAAIIPWFVLGLYLGNRGGEWAQLIAKYKLTGTFELNKFGQPKAFMWIDFRFSTAGKIRLPLSDCWAADRSHVGRVGVKYREQKNHEHGEEKLLVANIENPDLCAVRAAMDITRRFHELFPEMEEIPLSVYRGDDGIIYNITNDDIEAMMRQAAANVYGLDPRKLQDALDLSKWTSHSLRIGACVILYALGFTGEQIKKLLRWKSNIFMDYLRNLAETSRLQNRAMNDAAEIPNFL